MTMWYILGLGYILNYFGCRMILKESLRYYKNIDSVTILSTILLFIFPYVSFIVGISLYLKDYLDNSNMDFVKKIFFLKDSDE